MFDLNEKLIDWRTRFMVHDEFSDDQIEELESHLLESIEILRGKGLEEGEAFRRASENLGDAHTLRADYLKIDLNNLNFVSRYFLRTIRRESRRFRSRRTRIGYRVARACSILFAFLVMFTGARIIQLISGMDGSWPIHLSFFQRVIGEMIGYIILSHGVLLCTPFGTRDRSNRLWTLLMALLPGTLFVITKMGVSSIWAGLYLHSPFQMIKGALFIALALLGPLLHVAACRSQKRWRDSLDRLMATTGG